jgi:MFS family permease
MSRIGRRAGFIIGAIISAIGGATSCLAVLNASFVLLVIGFAIVGSSNAFTQQYRFAAADSGSPQLRAKAISWVLAGGVASGIIGPQAVILTRHLFDPVPFAGGFLAIVFLAAVRRAAPAALRRGAPAAAAGVAHWRTSARRDHPPAAVHRVADLRHRKLWPHEPRHDCGAAGDGRLRAVAG